MQLRFHILLPIVAFIDASTGDILQGDLFHKKLVAVISLHWQCMNQEHHPEKERDENSKKLEQTSET